MRHLKRNAKLGRKGDHRNAMLANMVCSLIYNGRITTTLAKAKAARPVAEKMVTLGKKGTLHHRRLASARLRQEDAVRILFNDLAPQHQARPGGYTRIIKLHTRQGDASQMAILEFVDHEVTVLPADEATAAPAETAAAPATESSATGEAPASEASDASAEESAEAPKEESGDSEKK